MPSQPGALELVVRARVQGRGLWLAQVADLLQPGDRLHVFLGAQDRPGEAISAAEVV